MLCVHKMQELAELCVNNKQDLGVKIFAQL